MSYKNFWEEVEYDIVEELNEIYEDTWAYGNTYGGFVFPGGNIVFIYGDDHSILWGRDDIEKIPIFLSFRKTAKEFIIRVIFSDKSMQRLDENEAIKLTETMINTLIDEFALYDELDPLSIVEIELYHLDESYLPTVVEYGEGINKETTYQEYDVNSFLLHGEKNLYKQIRQYWRYLQKSKQKTFKQNSIKEEKTPDTRKKQGFVR